MKKLFLVSIFSLLLTSCLVRYNGYYDYQEYSYYTNYSNQVEAYIVASAIHKAQRDYGCLNVKVVEARHYFSTWNYPEGEIIVYLDVCSQLRRYRLINCLGMSCQFSELILQH